MWKLRPTESGSLWLCGMCGIDFPREDILIAHLGHCQRHPDHTRSLSDIDPRAHRPLADIDPRDMRSVAGAGDLDLAPPGVVDYAWPPVVDSRAHPALHYGQDHRDGFGRMAHAQASLAEDYTSRFGQRYASSYDRNCNLPAAHSLAQPADGVYSHPGDYVDAASTPQRAHGHHTEGAPNLATDMRGGTTRGLSDTLPGDSLGHSRQRDLDSSSWDINPAPSRHTNTTSHVHGRYKDPECFPPVAGRAGPSHPAHEFEPTSVRAYETSHSEMATRDATALSAYDETQNSSGPDIPNCDTTQGVTRSDLLADSTTHTPTRHDHSAYDETHDTTSTDLPALDTPRCDLPVYETTRSTTHGTTPTDLSANDKRPDSPPHPRTPDATDTSGEAKDGQIVEATEASEHDGVAGEEQTSSAVPVSKETGGGSPSIELRKAQEDSVSQEDKHPIVLVYHCWICQDEFLDKWSIVLHLKAAHRDRVELRGIELKMRSPLCLDCGATEPCEHRPFPEEDSLDWDDVNMGDGAVPEEDLAWPCASCSQSFLSQKLLQKHRAEQHEGGKNFQCSFCPSKFVSHSHLVAHARIHTGFRPHPCSVCGNRFARRSDLERHSRTHTGEKPFRCVECGRTFSQRTSLEKHARIHARRSGALACEQCGLVVHSSAELAQHSATEHSERKFTCNTCGKTFSAQHYLQLHTRTHTMAKTYACSFCPKKFSFHALLVKHEDRVHKNQADIKCEQCGRTFKRRENLNRHMRSHTGEKSFQCPACGQAFTEKGSMKRHYQSQHEQIKPHDCPACEKSFSRKFLLSKHLQRYHPEMSSGRVEEAEPSGPVSQVGF
ncbi:zinc finger protein 543 isoform X2 [Aplysia californica]|uniref:Zinc finger protein 543 isoform X2 n=1 Tax=Aplysia californica TaxID=6500 RepID=A0ABM0JXM5_APLCA|nr:zinc finger protein 543 isoform X2 [Aplysia californica]